MANVQEVKNQMIQKSEKDGKTTQYKNIQELLKRMAPEIQRALPANLSADRLTRIMLTEIRQNPKLLDASQISLLGAVLTSAQLGLEPGMLGQVYLIPYYNKNTRTVEVQFQIGYKGLIELVRRSGEVTSISAHEVYEKDSFTFEYGIDEKLIHKPLLNGDRGQLIAVYAVAKFRNGGYAFEVMSIDDIEKLRKRSRTPDVGPWVTDYTAMAKKTVLKQLCKYLPIATEVAKAIANDETVKTTISEDMTEISADWIDVPTSDGSGEAAKEENNQ
ncbi:MAG: recombination protein RecT [Candidatus Micrarchaeaceae archaeon]